VIEIGQSINQTTRGHNPSRGENHATKNIGDVMAVLDCYRGQRDDAEYQKRPEENALLSYVPDSKQQLFRMK
jgi:hypothetical protein